MEWRVGVTEPLGVRGEYEYAFGVTGVLPLVGVTAPSTQPPSSFATRRDAGDRADTLGEITLGERSERIGGDSGCGTVSLRLCLRLADSESSGRG